MRPSREFTFLEQKVGAHLINKLFPQPLFLRGHCLSHVCARSRMHSYFAEPILLLFLSALQRQSRSSLGAQTTSGLVDLSLATLLCVCALRRKSALFSTELSSASLNVHIKTARVHRRRVETARAHPFFQWVREAFCRTRPLLARFNYLTINE